MLLYKFRLCGIDEDQSADHSMRTSTQLLHTLHVLVNHLTRLFPVSVSTLSLQLLRQDMPAHARVPISLSGGTPPGKETVSSSRLRARTVVPLKKQVTVRQRLSGCGDQKWSIVQRISRIISEDTLYLGPFFVPRPVLSGNVLHTVSVRTQRFLDVYHMSFFTKKKTTR